MMLDYLRKNKILPVAALGYLLTWMYNSEVFLEACLHTWSYLLEMLQVMPAVFVVASVVTVWVPREVIMRNFGSESGWRGKAASILIGSVSAGPIYAAFPIAQSLLAKGASIGNVVIIISAWAVIKLPMLIVESNFLGVDFMAVRYFFTVPALLVIGTVSARYLSREAVLDAAAVTVEIGDEVKERIVRRLPGYDCGACGYSGCEECARAMVSGEAEPSDCRVIGEDAREDLAEILEGVLE